MVFKVFYSIFNFIFKFPNAGPDRGFFFKKNEYCKNQKSVLGEIKCAYYAQVFLQVFHLVKYTKIKGTSIKSKIVFYKFFAMLCKP